MKIMQNKSQKRRESVAGLNTQFDDLILMRKIMFILIPLPPLLFFMDHIFGFK